MINKRISPSVIISTLALIVATTGTSIAATKISGQSIQNHTITANKLAKGAVTSRAVAAHAITPLALADGVIVNNTINAPAGPQGDPGAPGPNGVAAFDPSKIILAVGNDVAGISAGGDQTSTATCPAGSYVTGGGYSTIRANNQPTNVVLETTQNEGFATGWMVSVHNSGGIPSTTTWHAVAYCAA